MHNKFKNQILLTLFFTNTSRSKKVLLSSFTYQTSKMAEAVLFNIADGIIKMLRDFFSYLSRLNLEPED